MTQRRRNWAPWYGLFLALVSLLSNAAFFLALPGEKAIPFLSLALAAAALLCAAMGVMRAFRQPQTYGGKTSSSVMGAVSLLIVVLVMFASVHSRDLPVSAGAPQPGQKAPDFTLADSNGNMVTLEQLLSKGSSDGAAIVGASGVGKAPKAVLLVFYRGYW